MIFMAILKIPALRSNQYIASIRALLEGSVLARTLVVNNILVGTLKCIKASRGFGLFKRRSPAGRPW